MRTNPSNSEAHPSEGEFLTNGEPPDVTIIGPIHQGLRVLSNGTVLKIALVPVAVTLLLLWFGMLSITDSLKSVIDNPFTGAADIATIFVDILLWTIVVGTISAISYIIETIAVSIAVTADERMRVWQAYGAAIRRLPAVVGAWICIPFWGICALLIFLILRFLAGKVVLSVLVALLTIPLFVLGMLLILVSIFSIFIVPALAATTRSGPIEILKRSLGLFLRHPGPTIATMALSALLAWVVAVVLGMATYASSLFMTELVSNMLTNDRIGSATIVFIVIIGFVMLSIDLPRLIVVAATAVFTREVLLSSDVLQTSEEVQSRFKEAFTAIRRGSRNIVEHFREDAKEEAPGSSRTETERPDEDTE